VAHPDFPEPVGVFRAVERPTFEAQVVDQLDAAVAAKGPGKLDELFRSDDLWTVE
jgi:2-oxoglutarate/2-oxoacid ferredoxin oxidoreductase subunit beta